VNQQQVHQILFKSGRGSGFGRFELVEAEAGTSPVETYRLGCLFALPVFSAFYVHCDGNISMNCCDE